MRTHFKSIRRFMMLSAVIQPAVCLICFFLFAFGLGLWAIAPSVLMLILVPRLPQAGKIIGGKVPPPPPPRRESWLESIQSFSGFAIPVWFVMTPEAHNLWIRIVDERALLNGFLITAVTAYTGSAMILGLRSAIAVTDRDIYSYYTELESLHAEKKAQREGVVQNKEDSRLDSTISNLRS